MKKVLSLIISALLILSILAVPTSAYVDAEETGYNFDNLTADENGVFKNPNENIYKYRNRTAYTNASTAYNEVFITDEGSGDKAITLKSTKSANFGLGIAGFEYTGNVEIGVKFKIGDLTTVRYFGFYDCWHSSAPYLVRDNKGRIYIAGTDITALTSKFFAAGSEYDCTFRVNLINGDVHAVIKKDDSEWIDTYVAGYSLLKGKTLTNLHFYQTGYSGTNLTPSVSHWDDLYIKPISRFYNVAPKSYDFNSFTGSEDGYSAVPDDFTLAYGNSTTDEKEGYEGIFAQSTSRGTSIRAESNVKRTGSTKDAPYIYTNTNILSTETGVLEFSVMRPEKSAALYVNFGAYNKPLALVNRNGVLTVFDADTGITISKTDEWYDIKIQYSTEDLTAYVEVYNGDDLVGCSAIMQTNSSRNSYKYVKGTDVTRLAFGLYAFDSINPNEGDVSSIIFDDIKFGKTEDVHITSDGYEIFDIAYSSPITATKVPVGNDVKVTFNNTIDKTTFTSSAITVNSKAVPGEQISFRDDNHTVILSGVTTEAGKHYHIAFSNVSDVTGKTLTDYIEIDTKLPNFALSDVKFSRGTGADEYVYAVTEPGEINASFTALTNNGYTLDMLYYLGLYKENASGSELVSLDSSNLKISGAEREYKLSVTVPSDGSAYTVKAFRWSTKNIEPLCETAELRDINNQKVPLAIIKLDDLSVSNISSFEKWQQYAEDENIHLNFGVLCSSFAADGADASVARLGTIGKSSNVEVWLHGYDHAGGSGVTSEFREDIDSQTQTFADCLEVAKKADITFKSFNPPFNELNEDTANLLEKNNYSTVMLMTNSINNYMLNKNFVTLYNENALELNASNSSTDRVSTIEDFSEKYVELAELANTNGKNYIVYQGHPAQWDAASESKFVEIIEYLKSIGTAFIEPADYARIMAQK